MKTSMKGLVYGGPGKIELKEVPVPVIEKPTDVLVKIIKTTICGTDPKHSTRNELTKLLPINLAMTLKLKIYHHGRDSQNDFT